MAKAPKARTLFVSARAWTREKDNRRFGVVDLVIEESDGARVLSQFCDPSLAEAASREFAFLEAVNLEWQTEVTGRGARAELVGIEAAPEAEAA